MVAEVFPEGGRGKLVPMVAPMTDEIPNIWHLTSGSVSTGCASIQSRPERGIIRQLISCLASPQWLF